MVINVLINIVGDYSNKGENGQQKYPKGGNLVDFEEYFGIMGTLLKEIGGLIFSEKSRGNLLALEIKSISRPA